MGMVINTNIGSENAIRLLDKTSRSQAISMERLTSGARINGSKDDAAGLSIVTNMNSQVKGLGMAVRNANDGIAMIQTMDGAVEEVVNMLQRQRELSIQAMNGTYTSAQRSDMQTEFSQLTEEINRVASTTKFNGISVFATSTIENIGFQVGWENGGANRIGSGSLGGISFSDIALSLATPSFTGSAGDISVTVGALSGIISTIQTTRARWGAVMNRLDYSVNNLQNIDKNIRAARSQINDTNYAVESANLARTQVLSQAGMSMLSQSNQSSQNVLSLLR